MPHLVVLSLLLCCASVVVSFSCEGLCDHKLNTSWPCQCNSACANHNDCCDDYRRICESESCEGRCDAEYDPSLPCQCNDKCAKYNNCCDDYSEFCDPDVITDAEIKQITSKLWSVDVNSVGSLVSIDIQGETTSDSTSDEAPNHLLSINPDAYTGPTISKFRKLFDNYDPDQKNQEDDTAEELEERDAFIDAMLETQVMTELHLFLFEKHLVGETTAELKELLFNMWFESYDHKRSSGSSGFEHVFMGETSGTKVKGFHNFLHFADLESTDAINYMGWIAPGYTDLGDNKGIIDFRFYWDAEEANKPITGFYVGTSPEVEMAIGTVCFLARPGSICHAELNGVEVDVQTWRWHETQQIASAYPI